jgi:hypothetical protein
VSFQEFGNIEFEGGRLYHTAGKVADPEAGTIVGAYAGMNFLPFNNAPSVVVDSANNRVYFLAGGAADPGSPGQARIYAFDKTTFALVASFTVSGTVGHVGSLVQWNATGLAFRDDNAVYLIPTPVPGPPPSTPTPTPVPTPTATPLPGEFRQIALATKDLVVEPNTQNIYASVPSSAGALGNRLALIDPVSGTIASSVAVGSEPNRLAVSENGQYIYVGLDGDNAVRRFDVATQTAGPQFSTVTAPRDISAMPGTPNSIAVVRRSPLDEVLIYDNGVPRTITKRFDVTSIAFSNSPEVLYGAQTESTGYDFSKMTVASCGVGLAKGTKGMFPSEDIKYDNGRVYSTRGFAIDPEIPSLVGTFFVSNLGFPLVEPDSKANRIYSLSSTGSSATLNVFDMQTFVLLGSLSLPGVTGVPNSLVRWGANGLAFNTPTQVLLLQNALIAGPSPNYTPAPPPLPATFTVTGNVMSFATLEPTSGVTITFSGSQSGTTQTDAQGNFSISNVPLCGNLTVTATRTNWIFTPASIVITDPSTQRANFSSFHRIIGFVQSNVTVSEGTTKVFLALARSAGLPPVSTDIPYSTSSGTASDRSDFTPVFGTFHFDSDTSQAPIEVLITNDVFVEGSETFTATVEPIPGFDLVNPTVTVTIVDNDTMPPVASPLQNAQFFVRRHYHDFLNRDPDTAGLNFWTAQITACNAEPDPQKKADCFEERHVNVSAAFFFSIEFQATGYLVQRLYALSFPDTVSRPRGLPRFSEFLRDTQQIGRGVIVGQGNWQEILEQNTQAFVRSWVDLAEFRAQNPESLTADQYVDTLFARGGVVPSAMERAAAIAAYGSGGSEGRALALRSIAQSRSIYNRQYNPALVLMQYFGYLRRNPSDPPEPTLDFAGYDFWLNKLNEFSLPGEDVSNEAVALERVRRAQMVKSFLVSGEYMSRVGPDNFNIRQ